MTSKKIYTLLFLLIGLNALQAQQNLDTNILLWKITENNTVLLKWYGPDIYTKEPVNVYRKPFGADDSAWSKLNSQPIDILDELAGAADNTEDKLYEEAVKNGIDPAAKDIFNLLTILKSFESTPFAEFLGIYFEDNTATAGQAYQYKVMLLKNNAKEKELAISSKVNLAIPFILEPPKGIVANGINDKATFIWTIEESRYYGVDIFRSETKDGNFELINPKPILISEVEREDGTYDYPDVFYTDDSLQMGKFYYYYLKSRGFFADTSQQSEIVEILIRDEIPPLPITGLKASQPDEKTLGVQLEWTPSADIDIKGYYVQRKVTGDFKTVSPLIPAGQLTYMDNAPKANSYLYRILSVDNSDNETPSLDIIMKVNDNNPPIAPQNLQTKGEEGAIRLSWDANTESDIMGYFVYRIENDYRDREMLLLNADFIANNVFIDSMPKIAKNTFVYRVAAIDSSYNIGPKSDFSEAQMPDVTPPIKPAINRAYLRDDTIHIEWLPNLEADLAGYHLLRSEQQEPFDWKVISGSGLFNPTNHQFLDTDLAASMTYAYQLVAFDLDGNKSENSEIHLVETKPPAIKTEPSPKLSLKLDKKDKKSKKIKIKWKLNENPALTSLSIYRKQGSGRFIPLESLPTTEKEYMDEDIESEKNYTYQLRMYYSDGNVVLSKSEAINIK